ncbi:MAG: hypothetical protein HYR68_12740 [Burkholderiales bacterium]|nr:hypothetical protein [Burkholderiales bacterium]MBI3727212.1 hypothetical protein [Burkholderiales bacterium]
MANYFFTISYDRRGNAIGQYVQDVTSPPLTGAGVPILYAGDTITYQYVFVGHGIAQSLNSAVISESVVNAIPMTPGSNDPDPFVNGTPIPGITGAYQVALNSPTNPSFTVTISQVYARAPTELFRFSGAFKSTLTNQNVVVSWDPESEIGTGG